ncbi:FAD-binding oxidoreductase [Larkinella sp. VNQ87]|uniref:FAD-binding oxidoreductase n=1 Tax=Larkinella sp. VNQ87 TaxID=3400921 RepID=UPI003BFAECD9
MLKSFLFGVFTLLSIGTTVAQTASSGSRYPVSYPNRQIQVGEGGGFTGSTRTYCLLENGLLFVKSDTDSLYKPLDQKPATTTRRLFRQLEKTCRIQTTRFNHPGNLYQFVRWQKGKTEYTVTWGDRTQPAPACFVQFYKTFMAQIPPNKRS